MSMTNTSILHIKGGEDWRRGLEKKNNTSMALASSSCVLDPERVITELSRGREIADRLRLMLREADSDSSVLSAQSLVTQLLDTFTHSLTMLRPSSPAKSEQDSGDSCKTPPPPPKAKDRRGCYKRKRNSETTVIKESPNMVEDGHAWRKYGQKVILNAKHPRNYFRCTHKYEQGCQASKQVQKVQDNPPLYRTTYNGHHTCTSNTLTTTTNLLYDHHHHTTDHNNLISISSPSSPADAVIWSFSTTPTAAVVIKHEEIHKSPSPRHDDCYMADLTDVYSCSASASDDNTNYIGDDISIDDFFELGTPLSS